MKQILQSARSGELELAEVRRELEQLAEQWHGGERAFVERVRRGLDELVRRGQWKSSFLGRVAALLGGQRALGRLLAQVGREAREAGIPAQKLRAILHLAREAHRTSTAAAHYEDLRAVLSSWRYLHRWVAALMLILLVLHVAYALTYSSLGGGAH